MLTISFRIPNFVCSEVSIEDRTVSLRSHWVAYRLLSSLRNIEIHLESRQRLEESYSVALQIVKKC